MKHFYTLFTPCDALQNVLFTMYQYRMHAFGTCVLHKRVFVVGKLYMSISLVGNAVVSL